MIDRKFELIEVLDRTEIIENCILIKNNRLTYPGDKVFTREYLKTIDKHAFHLFEVNDDIIADGDYILDSGEIFGPFEEGDTIISEHARKIVKTTDKKLIKNTFVIEFQLEDIIEIINYFNQEANKQLKKFKTKNNKFLKTEILPLYNCSNCEHFIAENKKILDFSKTKGKTDFYAYECRNLVHPLSDCILNGFEGHSSQPGFSQTINK